LAVFVAGTEPGIATRKAAIRTAIARSTARSTAAAGRSTAACRRASGSRSTAAACHHGGTAGAKIGATFFRGATCE
jgi:hypothetical protein